MLNLWRNRIRTTSRPADDDARQAGAGAVERAPEQDPQTEYGLLNRAISDDASAKRFIEVGAAWQEQKRRTARSDSYNFLIKAVAVALVVLLCIGAAKGVLSADHALRFRLPGKAVAALSVVGAGLLSALVRWLLVRSGVLGRAGPTAAAPDADRSAPPDGRSEGSARPPVDSQ